MKRLLSLIFVLCLCLSLCACGEEAPAVIRDTTPTVEKPPVPADAKTVAGTYQSRLWFMDHAITLQENGDSTYGDQEGYFTYTEPSVSLLGKDGTTRNFLVENDYMYTFDSWYFDADTTYGTTFTPDADGRTDQAFIGKTDGNIPGSDYNWILLDLNTDGTFSLQLGNETGDSPEIKETFEGKYTVGKYTLTLTYQGKDYTLITSNANYIYFCIYDKA